MKSFLSQSQVEKWRALSHLDEWEITKSWGEGSRKAVGDLAPAFVVEDEVLIFDAPVCSGWLCTGDVRFTQVNHRGFKVERGFLLATDSRFVFGSSKPIRVDQIHYASIRSITSNRDKGEFTLLLEDGTQALFKAKFPQPSVMAVFSVLAANSSTGQSYELDRENRRVAIGKNFTANFLDFLTEIVDEGRRKRQG